MWASGQGRDALALGELGYRVIGVDHSSVGINQLNQEAKKRGLNVQGIVGDMHDYQITEDIDIVLLDSMLHFYKNDQKKETEFVNKILNQLKENGLFVTCILKGDKRESILKQIIDQSPYEWTVLSECYTEYIEFNATYHLLVVKKGKRIK
ncbi:class I SAM-dependent methyltransferase [Paraliobacillus salinarum]|uniref:class I SAM-dependent methyltransferase n=1 Tax=Paraliobacillus salinarum TaxID=1158996 RepID=UPI001FE2D63E|nr:class I SAM-dependent methyltransferase [Paraliobacillus salinarum]